MSLSTTTGSAERLHRASGAWRLEFEQLVFNAPAILRPRRFAVSGEHAILQQLRELGSHEPLAKDAERLFARGAVPDGTYIARNGRWLPELRPDLVMSEPEPEDGRAAAGGVPTEAVDELSGRISSLENTVRALQKVVDAAMRALSDGGPAPARPAAATGSSAGMGAASVAVAPPAPRPMAAEPPGVSADPIASAAAAIMAPRPQKAIQTPSVAALSELVKSLAGSDATLSPTDKIDWSTQAANGPIYAAPIRNGDDDEVGAMVMDIESSLRLAGALLMESEEMVTSLLEEKMMSDEMLDAASEVCNTLMSAFNKISGNPHLRAGKLVVMSPADAAWLADARKCDDYRFSHGGRLAMAIR